ncbi:sulfite exporter TauE/SafE family protein [Thiocystis violacea]|uniref:sulfite exporter TauE/SafE family protein n=1 Tax=Thiocystis violacea TaxID=13725 RepID=UPI001903DB97|nr:sulfite exporter TauE/SafE family protein [Thiocystis violacea]MBK1718436.1 hypothetical protein [Thiocystis violacea]
MNAAYPLAFLVGLLSALHCIGMCGSIVGALSFSLPREIRVNPARYLVHQLAFNLGRIASYALAGALFGWLGAALTRAGPLGWLDDLTRLATATVLIGIGLHIGGWFPRFALIERLGVPLWRRLDPLTRRLLPVRGPLGALLFGAVWGWLPCGLVYSLLISAPLQAGAASGALYMALFGLGTLPVLLATGFLAGRLHAWGRDRRFQSIAGATLIALALLAIHYQAYNGASMVPS